MKVARHWKEVFSTPTAIVEYCGDDSKAAVVRIRTDVGHIYLGEIDFFKATIDQGYRGLNALEFAEKVQAKIGGMVPHLTDCIAKLRGDYGHG